MKIRPFLAELFPCEHRDMTKLIFALRKFAKATNKIVPKDEFITEPKCARFVLLIQYSQCAYIII